jgi:Rrf2 family protein
MHVPAKVEYAIQAAAELAAAHPGLVKAEQIANAQQIPPKYLQNILTQLRNAGLVESHRGGTEGGYRLARPAHQITLANIIRAAAGPLTNVRGARPQSLHYPDPASHLPKVWIAVRVSLRSILEQVKQDVAMQLPLPGLLSPALERLRAAVADDDPQEVAAVLPAALAEVDTPLVRAGLVRAVQALRDAGRVSDEVAAAVAVEQASRSTTLLRASLLAAVAVSVGAARIPAGLLVVSRS